ncbi:MAG: indolepyruvate oxidoreductase subunit beta [Desulfitibacter sp. BRH_c19]|nr:MAG: indolepyruvate oxidoreductase subunit beta [Desulfitibacter sp. BRH_c19]
MADKSILIVGVGGQGTLLASKVLGQVVMQEGLDIKMSEVHGMAQRGGSVVTQVRFGEKIYSPLIPDEGADIILSFEMMEALRYLPLLKKDGKIIINEQKIAPMPVLVGAVKYPEDPIKEIQKMGIEVIGLKAYELAKEAGNMKAANVVLLGVLAKDLDFDENMWENAIKETVPERFLEVNMKAFEMGYNYNI